MGGHWGWQGGQHVWSPGRWEPGRPGHVWVDSHWRHEGGQWGFYQGHWLPTAHAGHAEMVVAAAPPAPHVEVAPAYHEPGHEWHRGHFEYHGERHVWFPGRYEPRPERSHWVDHRWEHRADGRYHFYRGHWRRD
jgi:hypothetical protein